MLVATIFISLYLSQFSFLVSDHGAMLPSAEGYEGQTSSTDSNDPFPTPATIKTVKTIFDISCDADKIQKIRAANIDDESILKILNQSDKTDVEKLASIKKRITIAPPTTEQIPA